MIHGIILTDNTYNEFNYTVNRGTGAHRIASHLRNHGYNIEVVDYCLRWTLSEFQQLCNKLVHDQLLFLGIGSNLFYDRDSFNELIVWFKKTYPTIPIVLGGNNTLVRDIPCVDYYIEGYAENAILPLMDFFQGRIKETDIKWSSYRANTKLIDAYQDYGAVDTADLTVDYLAQDFLSPHQSLGLETARGCIFKCSFCTYPLIGKKKIDYIRNPETIVNELQQNYDRWGITRYVINEDTFNDSIEKLRVLEKAIARLPFSIEFVAYARLDLLMAKPEAVELLRNMGMRGVHFGIETFNREAGKIVGKGIDPERLKQGLIWWKSLMPQVTTHCSMIVGLPGDTDDYQQHADWFSKNQIDSWLWAPLYITDLSKTMHASEFSRTFKEHGYVAMTEEEINQEIEIERQLQVTTPDHTKAYQTYLIKTFREKLVFWKNPATGDNYFKATRLATKLNAQGQTRRPWMEFDWCSMGYSIDEIQSWGRSIPRVSEQVLEQQANDLVNAYKTNKINFDYQGYYLTHSNKNKRIIKINIAN